MSCKDDERPRIVPEVEEDRNAGYLDAARLLAKRIEIKQPIEEDILRRQPPHIAPARQGNLGDLRLALLRKSVA